MSDLQLLEGAAEALILDPGGIAHAAAVEAGIALIVSIAHQHGVIALLLHDLRDVHLDGFSRCLQGGAI